jgi:hypothetical protein
MNKVQCGDATVCLPAERCLALCQQLPRAVDLDSAMRSAEQFRQAVLGNGLMTVNWVHSVSAERIKLQRIWSSMPQEYPVGGTKVKVMTDWTRQLLLRSETFVGEGTAALEAVFDDVRLIVSMGLRAVVNVPLVRQDGSCFATFNVLGTHERWTAADRGVISLLAELVRPHVAAHVSLN